MVRDLQVQHLPWLVLQDGQAHLVQQEPPVIQDQQEVKALKELKEVKVFRVLKELKEEQGQLALKELKEAWQKTLPGLLS